MALGCSSPTSGWPRRSGSEGTPRSTSRRCSSTPSTIATRRLATRAGPRTASTRRRSASRRALRSARARFSSDWGSTGRSLTPVRGPWSVVRGSSLAEELRCRGQLCEPRTTNYEHGFPNVQLPKGPAKAGPFSRWELISFKSLCGTHVDNSFKHPPRSRQPTGCRRLSRASAAARHRRRRPLPR